MLFMILCILSARTVESVDSVLEGAACISTGEFCDIKNTKRYDTFAKEAPDNEFQKPKVILFWTTFFGRDDFEFGFGQRPFLENGCKINNCITTNDKTRYKEASAVIFHMRNVDYRTKFPDVRLDWQQYVFFLQEHPYHQWNDLSKFDQVFNLTMTYLKDSDVRIPYGNFFPRVNTDEFDPRGEIVELVKSKTKLVAWFASNCDTHSKREKYVEQLQKYIPIDVYGKCGPLRCPDKNVHDPRMDPHCYEMVNKTYKFYISFENIMCEDYVTEKLFDALQLYVVPIVYGGVNYTTHAPPNSVINIDNFSSPKQLAEYLLQLDEDHVSYVEYFRWKSSYDVISKPAYREGFCDLCEKLHEPRDEKVYDNLEEWWGKTTRCDVKSFEKLNTP